METPEGVVAWIEARLRAAGDPARAVQEQRYLKSSRPFYGCGGPAVRRVAKSAIAEFGIGTRDALEPVAEALWAGEPFENRMVAIEMLVLRLALLGRDDLRWLHRWIAAGETWALVDRLSTAVAGDLVSRDPLGAEVVLDCWAVDESFWVRRASMLALLPSLRVSDDRWGQFCRYAEALMDEREFFVRKAIGWVTREVAKRRPDTARPWVEAQLGRMSSVTRREAIKYL